MNFSNLAQKIAKDAFPSKGVGYKIVEESALKVLNSLELPERPEPDHDNSRSHNCAEHARQEMHDAWTKALECGITEEEYRDACKRAREYGEQDVREAQTKGQGMHELHELTGKVIDVLSGDVCFHAPAGELDKLIRDWLERKSRDLDCLKYLEVFSIMKIRQILGLSPIEPEKVEPLDKINQLIEIQKQSLHDKYMVGLHNGLEFAKSCITGNEPKYADCAPRPTEQSEKPKCQMHGVNDCVCIKLKEQPKIPDVDGLTVAIGIAANLDVPQAKVAAETAIDYLKAKQ